MKRRQNLITLNTFTGKIITKYPEKQKEQRTIRKAKQSQIFFAQFCENFVFRC